MTLFEFNKSLAFFVNVYGSVLYEAVSGGFFHKDDSYTLEEIEANARFLSDDFSPDDMSKYGDREFLWHGFVGRSVIVVSSGKGE